MAAYAATIDGSPVEFLPGAEIHEVANARATFTGVVRSIGSPQFRAPLDAPLVITEDATPIMGGPVQTVRELGFGAADPDALDNEVIAGDYNALAHKRIVLADLAAGTLKSQLTTLVARLADLGTTLDAGQVDGPDMPAQTVKYLYVDEALSILSKATEWPWNISFANELSMVDPSTVAAPFDITDGDDNAIGDVEVEISREDYGNRVYYFAGDGEHVVTDERHEGDGSTVDFPLRLPLLAFIGVDITYGVRVDRSGSVSVERLSLSTDAGVPGDWIYDPATGILTQNNGAVLASGHFFLISYLGQFPLLIVVDDLVEQGLYGIVERAVKDPDTFDPDAAQLNAEAELSKAVTKKTVTYTTLGLGLHPGQTQTISLSKRNLSGTHLISEVTTTLGVSNVVTRRVVAVGGTVFRGSYRDTYDRWNQSGASSSARNAGSSAGGSAGEPPPIGGEQLKAEIDIQDAQILALDTTPVPLVSCPAGYRLVIDFAIVRTNFSGGAYTNIDPDAYLVIKQGPDELTNYIGNDSGATPPLDTFDEVFSNPFAQFKFVEKVRITSGWDDAVYVATNPTENAGDGLALFMVNGSSGDLTGGDSANFMRVSVYYRLQAGIL